MYYIIIIYNLLQLGILNLKQLQNIFKIYYLLFKSLLKFIGNYNLISKNYSEFIEKYQNITNYTYYAVQDELAQLCPDNIRNKITKEIENNKIFSIICDEA